MRRAADLLAWAVRTARAEERSIPGFVLSVLEVERKHRAAADLLRAYEREHGQITPEELQEAEEADQAAILRQTIPQSVLDRPTTKTAERDG